MTLRYLYYSWAIRDIVLLHLLVRIIWKTSDKANVNKLLSSYITNTYSKRKNQNELKLSIDTATEKGKKIY